MTGRSVLIVDHYGETWRIMGRDNRILCTIRKDVYAPQVVLRTAQAILKRTLTQTCDPVTGL